jgi:uncharacterized protein YndB with AHSA1/START domain
MTTIMRNPAETSSDRVLAITRIFNAPRHLVFEAWTKKKHLDRWSVPHGLTIPFSEAEVRPGGAWRCSIRAPDGVVYRVGGTYRKVVEDALLVFTHAWEDEAGQPGHETVVTVQLADHGDQTKAVLEQATFKTVRSRDSHEGGWNECLLCLAEYLASCPRNGN